jgi:DNA-binding CsgD family transcriptional regulator
LEGVVGLATVSAAAHDPEAAERHIDEAFSIAHEFDLSLALGDAYLVRAELRLRAGDSERADDDAHEALRTFSAAGAKTGIVRSLEMLGEVAAAAESYEEAARLLSAGDTLRATIGFARYPVAEAAYNDAWASAQKALGTEAFDAAAAEGAALTLDDTVAYATRARGERKRPSSGWASLTPTELEVVRLAAEGLTNPEIGARMFITRGTVKVHLSHIFAKLGVSTRAELASEATLRGLRDAGAR